MSKLLVTGGAGYIGSHFVLEALQSDKDVVVVDNLERGYRQALDRVEKISGRSLKFIQGDLRDKSFVLEMLELEKPSCILHFAGYKSVSEGQKEPQKYFENNVESTRNILNGMKNAGTKRIVFSSTAATYGMGKILPINENSIEAPISVYGVTKLTSEKLINGFKSQYPELEAVIFRYFNAVGAHESGLIGEDPANSTNLIPIAAKSILNKSQFQIFGNHFQTQDGYQERDYIHVCDLATAHLKAVNLDLSNNSNYDLINLSTGVPTSCLEIIQILEKISNHELDYVISEPRDGDPERLFASSEYAYKRLGWKAKYDVKKSIEDYWNWLYHNPNGYEAQNNN